MIRAKAKRHDSTRCSSCTQGVPHVAERCPRCHRPAPRMDGVVCSLCAPRGVDGVTMTDPKTGVTHAYRRGCATTEAVDIATTTMRFLNVGNVRVTCLECLGREAS